MWTIGRPFRRRHMCHLTNAHRTRYTLRGRKSDWRDNLQTDPRSVKARPAAYDQYPQGGLVQAHQPSLLEVRRRCDGRIRSLGSLGACVARVAVGSDGSRRTREARIPKPQASQPGLRNRPCLCVLVFCRAAAGQTLSPRLTHPSITSLATPRTQRIYTLQSPHRTCSAPLCL